MTNSFFRELYPWVPWFAWHPVRLQGSRRWAWWRVVMRRKIFSGLGFVPYYAEPFEIAIGMNDSAGIEEFSER